jgi:hypothetical protein
MMVTMAAVADNDGDVRKHLHVKVKAYPPRHSTLFSAQQATGAANFQIAIGHVESAAQLVQVRHHLVGLQVRSANAPAELVQSAYPEGLHILNYHGIHPQNVNSILNDSGSSIAHVGCVV